MAALKYRDEHNKVGFLEKSKGSTDYDQVIDFLLDSHIRYAIVSDPLIYDSLIKQFWSTASLLSSESGPPAIVAKIDGTPYTITESLVRSSLLLNDEGGIVDMSIAEIYTGMHNLGYPTEGKLTIHKNKFSPQWRFLIHTLLHCLSTKSGSWDQFGSPLAIALICLCEGRKYNWSSYIFNGMVNNIQNSNKFLMYPRFLQMILNIETRNTKPYRAFRLTSKMFANMRLNFHGDPMPLLATMLAPAQPAIAGESSGEAEPSVPPNVPETVIETVHSHEQGSTLPRPAPTNTDAQQNEQGPFSDPTSTQAHDSIPDLVPSTNVEDESLEGTFFATPPRSPVAPPKGTTSRGAADPLNLTALCTLVMGKLVKRVKFLESKLKARGRKVFVSESDTEEAEEQDVDPLIKLAKAAATAADTSSIPANDNHTANIPPGSSTPTTAFGSASNVPTGPSFEFSADSFNKGKSPMIEEDPPIKPRSFRQLEEDRLGAEAAKKLYEEEQAELTREQEERQRKRQEDVLNSAKYYTDDDWIHIMGQVHANQGLTADLLGPDVTEENFAERMVKVIAERRRQFEKQRFIEKRNKPMTYAQQKEFMRTYVKNQSSVIYSTGWTLKHVKSFSDATLQEEFNRIRHAVENLQTQILRRSIKRPGADLDQHTSKKSKSNEAQHTSVPPASNPSTAGVPSNPSPFVDTPPHSPKVTPVSPPKPSVAAPSNVSSHPDVPPETSVDPTVTPTPPCATPVSRSSRPRTRSQSFDADIKTYSTRRKSLAPRKMPSSEVDLNAPDTSFITVLSDDVSDASDDDTDPLFWHIFAAWEVIPTGLGDVNALYFTDKTSKYFTHLREILHLLDRQDLSKLYGMVVKHYEVNPLAGNGLILWGDLHVLFESTSGGSSVDVWNDQQEWVIHSWKLFPFSGVHVLETFSGKILYMFADTPYPLSASLMKKMLKHKLEVEVDGVGNDMTYAVQLIKFIKNQLASCVPSD
ncbi:hypothetical protein Tco_1111503 [Tanacetum coccineum]|uniref:Synaptobrevin, longin-like domain protein n=1 Tax=Tanacetum coccineum TaxID=301880 RepID=A0ABQ5IN96_9ASTR